MSKRTNLPELNCLVDHGNNPCNCYRSSTTGFAIWPCPHCESLRSQLAEAEEALKQAKIGLHEAVIERDAPCFRWPLEVVEKYLSQIKHPKDGEGK